MNIHELKSHAFDCIMHRDKWQIELNATLEAIKNYKEEEESESKEKNEAN